MMKIAKIFLLTFVLFGFGSINAMLFDEFKNEFKLRTRAGNVPHPHNCESLVDDIDWWLKFLIRALILSQEARSRDPFLVGQTKVPLSDEAIQARIDYLEDLKDRPDYALVYQDAVNFKGFGACR